MKKYYPLLLLLLFQAAASVAQNKDLDSLYTALGQHPQEDTARAKILFKILYLERDAHPEKSKSLAQELLQISKKINYTKGESVGFRYLAEYNLTIGNHGQSTKYAYEMLRVSEKSSYAEGIGLSYFILGRIKEAEGDPENAKINILKALGVFEKANLKMLMGSAYNNLGAMHFKLSKLDQSFAYYLKSLEIRKEINDVEGLGQTYGNLAIIYHVKGEYPAAFDNFKKALSITEKMDNKFRTAAYYNSLAKLYITIGEYNKAEFYILRSIALNKRIRHKSSLIESYESFVVLESARKRYKKALNYLKLKYQYRDSVYTENKAKQIAESEVRYETEKKDQSIKTFLQEKKIQKLTQRFLVIGLLTLAIAFIIIYLLQRRHNRKSRALNLKLQESDKVKSRFFANISHEFRTPLSLILAPIEEKLSSPRLINSDKESFQLIRRNANKLLDLVNQLLDLSKLEAGKMELQLQRGNIEEFVKVLAASFDSLGENKKILFMKDIQVDGIETWYDADKLEKIMNNVLSNAFKFTPEGGCVILSICSTAEGNYLKIGVRDTGKGISIEDQKHIFSPFYQGRHMDDNDQQGTGLGLSMVKELVKLYGGTIELASQPNLGTTITVIVPIKKEKFPDHALLEESTAKSDYKKLKDSSDGSIEEDEESEMEEQHPDTILIIEDNTDLRNFISSTLQKQFTVLTAKDGEEGYTVAVEHIPSLIISDVMMPRLDGIGLTEKIKIDERTSHIPVVLLTAKADLESRMEGLKKGADDYLTKPFSTEELCMRVTNLIEQRKKLAAKYGESFSSMQPTTLTHGELSLDEKFLQKVIKVVEDNMSEYDFNIDKLANEIHLSRGQLFRKVKALTGFPPAEFIKDLRLKKAATMILNKEDIVTQIGYSVGFNDHSYFAKCFKKKFGVSPSDYSGEKLTAVVSQ